MSCPHAAQLDWATVNTSEYRSEYYWSAPGLARATSVQWTTHTDIVEYSWWLGCIVLEKELPTNLKTCIDNACNSNSPHLLTCRGRSWFINTANCCLKPNSGTFDFAGIGGKQGKIRLESGTPCHPSKIHGYYYFSLLRGGCSIFVDSRRDEGPGNSCEAVSANLHIWVPKKAKSLSTVCIFEGQNLCPLSAVDIIWDFFSGDISWLKPVIGDAHTQFMRYLSRIWQKQPSIVIQKPKPFAPGNFLAYRDLRFVRTVKGFVRDCIFYPKIFAYLRPNIAGFSGHSLVTASRGPATNLKAIFSINTANRAAGIFCYL